MKKFAGSRRIFRHTKLIALLVLVAGLVLFGRSVVKAANIVKNGDVNVTATVYGPPPTTAASIDSPVNGQIITRNPLTVIGSCPDEGLEIRIYDNGQFVGSTICQADGSFTVDITLTKGSNQLVAKERDWQGQSGPDSAPVTVTYNPAITSGPVDNGGGSSGGSSGGGSGTSSQVPQLTIDLSDNFSGYKGYQVGQQLTLPIKLRGGASPYSVTINWQDGQQTIVSLKSLNEALIASHAYQKAGYYEVEITATDSSGQKAIFNVLVIVNGAPGAPITSTGSPTPVVKDTVPLYVWSLLLLLPLGYYLGKLRLKTPKS